jgi:hypothetical protein
VTGKERRCCADVVCFGLGGGSRDRRGDVGAVGPVEHSRAADAGRLTRLELPSLDASGTVPALERLLRE